MRICEESGLVTVLQGVSIVGVLLEAKLPSSATESEQGSPELVGMTLHSKIPF